MTLDFNFMNKIFNLQKNKYKKTEGQPDYRISFKTEDSFVEGGACWIKKDKSGNTYLSCKLGDVYVDHTDMTKTRKGWHIEEDKKILSEDEEFVASTENDVVEF